MLISKERVRLKITDSKIPLRYTGYIAIFLGKSKTKNQPVKNSVKGRQGTMLLPQEKND